MKVLQSIHSIVHYFKVYLRTRMHIQRVLSELRKWGCDKFNKKQNKHNQIKREKNIFTHFRRHKFKIRQSKGIQPTILIKFCLFIELF